MLWMPYCEAMAGLSSVFNLAILTRPAYSDANWSMMGATIRHGPHQGAQQSTRTVPGKERTSCLKFRSVISTG
jgi:hypothetical protein